MVVNKTTVFITSLTRPSSLPASSNVHIATMRASAPHARARTRTHLVLMREPEIARRRASTLARATLPASSPSAPKAIESAIAAAPWRGGLEPAPEISPTSARVALGSIPSECAGAVYRCGPGRSRLGATPYAHWFDGDGYVARVTLAASTNTATAEGKYVKTTRYEKQRASDGGSGWEGDVGRSGVAVRGAWTQANGILRNLGKFPTNPANTSIMVRDGKVLALCEGGAPVEVDARTLETVGEVVFGDELPMGFSAHSKRDDRDGTVYTWGLKKPPFIGIGVGKIDAKGKVTGSVDIPFPGAPEFTLLHDCAMSENYLTFFICPWILPPGNIAGALSGLKSFGHSFEWSDERDTWMVIMRKSDLSVVHAKYIPRFSSYHVCDSYENGDELSVLVCKLRGDRAGLEKNFANMYDAKWSSRHYNNLHEIKVDVKTGRVLSDEPVIPPNADGEKDLSKMIGMEFPAVSPQTKSRRKPKYVYTLANTDGEHGYFDCLQKLNLETRTAETRMSASGHFPHEAEFIPKANSTDEDAGYLVHFEYDARRRAANVVIVDAQNFTGDAVAVIELPFLVPYTFHGAFVPA